MILISSAEVPLHPFRRIALYSPRRILLPAVLALTFVATPGPTRLLAQYTRIDPDGRAVLITGATSGIGLLTAKLLAERGFFVYAGARKGEDMASLNALEGVQAVRLDVTVPEQITPWRCFEPEDGACMRSSTMRA